MSGASGWHAQFTRIIQTSARAMVQARVRVPARVDLRRQTIYPVGIGLTPKRLQIGCPLISLGSETKRNESENERSELP